MDSTRRALIRGTIDAIINQDPGHEVRSAVRVLMAKADTVPLIESQERIRIDIFLAEGAHCLGWVTDAVYRQPTKIMNSESASAPV